MKKIALLLVCLILAACNSAQTLNLTCKPLSIDIAKTADPNAITMLPVNFRVVNKDNLDSFLSELKAAQGGNNPVFLAISTKDYENMAINMADIRRYIEQQQSIIVYYRTLTAKPQ